MLYKERKPNLISAFQFTSPQEIPEQWRDTIVPATMSDAIVSGAVSADAACDRCGRSFKEHGITSNVLICPNSYIIYTGETITNVCNARAFEEAYVTVGEVVAEI